MKQFFWDTVRGVFIGLLVGYLIRPEAEIFDKIGDAVDDGEDYFDLLMDYPSEYLLTGGAVGAALGITVWFVRKKKSGRKPVVSAKKKKK